MKISNVIPLIVALLVSLSSQSQDKEDYWKLTRIYREDRTDFKASTGAAMQEILDENFHFIRKGDTLFFELPTKFKVAIHHFKSLSQLNITGKEYYEMYEQSFHKDTFNIKFRDNATMSDSKNTIIEFCRIPKAEFGKDIETAIMQQKEMEEKIIALKQHPLVVMAK